MNRQIKRIISFKLGLLLILLPVVLLAEPPKPVSGSAPAAASEVIEIAEEMLIGGGACTNVYRPCPTGTVYRVQLCSPKNVASRTQLDFDTLSGMVRFGGPQPLGIVNVSLNGKTVPAVETPFIPGRNILQNFLVTRSTPPSVIKQLEDLLEQLEAQGLSVGNDVGENDFIIRPDGVVQTTGDLAFEKSPKTSKTSNSGLKRLIDQLKRNVLGDDFSPVSANSSNTPNASGNSSINLTPTNPVSTSKSPNSSVPADTEPTQVTCTKKPNPPSSAFGRTLKGLASIAGVLSIEQKYRRYQEVKADLDFYKKAGVYPGNSAPPWLAAATEASPLANSGFYKIQYAALEQKYIKKIRTNIEFQGRFPKGDGLTTPVDCTEEEAIEAVELALARKGLKTKEEREFLESRARLQKMMLQTVVE